MSNLSHTLKIRLKAYEARQKKITDQQSQIIGQNSTLAEYKHISELAISQDFGTIGLNICAISNIQNQTLLLVNLDRYNTLKSMLTVDFSNLHALCFIEMNNVSDAGEDVSTLYSSQTIVTEDYCVLLGQDPNCDLSTALTT